jgi:hypothetical protein
MKLVLSFLLLLTVCLTFSCASASRGSQSAALNACSLITADEFSAEQGEPLKEAKVTNRADGDLDVSQCFLAAPTFSKSVSLIVTTNTRGKDPSGEMKKLWESRFSTHDKDKDDDERKDTDKDKDTKSAAKPSDRGEEDESSNAVKVDDIGDEAFWMGDARAGILYVLKDNSYLRISLGGADDQDIRLTKAKALATAALARLK